MAKTEAEKADDRLTRQLKKLQAKFETGDKSAVILIQAAIANQFESDPAMAFAWVSRQVEATKQPMAIVIHPDKVDIVPVNPNIIDDKTQ